MLVLCVPSQVALCKAHVIINVDVVIQEGSLERFQGQSCDWQGEWPMAGLVDGADGGKLNWRGQCICQVFEWMPGYKFVGWDAIGQVGNGFGGGTKTWRAFNPTHGEGKWESNKGFFVVVTGKHNA